MMDFLHFVDSASWKKELIRFWGQMVSTSSSVQACSPRFFVVTWSCTFAEPVDTWEHVPGLPWIWISIDTCIMLAHLLI